MENETEFKLNEHGDIDLNYYMHKAEVMRADCIKQMYTDFKNLLHSFTHKVATKLFHSHQHLPH